MDSTKADSDRKSYRLIKLHNGLRILLVHDPPEMLNGWACLILVFQRQPSWLFSRPNVP